MTLARDARVTTMSARHAIDRFRRFRVALRACARLRPSLAADVQRHQVRRRDWSSGVVEIHDQTAVGEARAIKEKVIDRFRAGVESLRGYLVKKFGAAEADSVLPAAGGVAARKISTYGTDNAAAALLSHQEIQKIVEEDVIAHVGDGEWAKLGDDEKKKLVKVWGTTCMRHLANTFLDGGVKRDSAWLAAKLADSVAAAPWRLRLNGDLNKLFHACAKGLGEGIDLYGRGVGAKRYRPFLKKNFPRELHLTLERFDKGARQDGSTQVSHHARVHEWVSRFSRGLCKRDARTRARKRAVSNAHS